LHEFASMVNIEKTIISSDIWEKKFVCDLSQCKGSCCVHGDSGAPLTEEEANILEALFPKIKPYLREAAVVAIEEQGKWVIDSDGDIVTPLINEQECAYCVFFDGVAFCGIEQAFSAGIIDFQKPLSCHLYPIRITKYKDFDALNYHEWVICKPACLLGKKENVSILRFLKEPLIRAYGEKWYTEAIQFSPSKD